jgi:hypothetical protein
MSVLKRTLALVLALGMVVMFFSACERNITRVEEVAGGPANCFDCHSDANLALVAAEAQWKNSVHASGLNIDRGASASCAACHSAEGFIQRANGETVTGHDNASPIHCFACHAPHSNGDFRLRWTNDATLEDGTSFDLGAGNLCTACHIARRAVDDYVGDNPTDRTTITSTHWGPHHGNQGDMLLGSNGYEYAGYTYEQTMHRQATVDGCVDCHFRATSNSVVGGHAFNMRFIGRAEGGEEEEYDNTAACAPCHGGIDDFNVGGVQDSVETLAAELEGLLEAAGLWEDGHPKAGVTTSVDSAGAVWNLASVHDDRSHGVHNARYTIGLLNASILFMEGNLPSPGGPAVAEEQLPWLTKRAMGR